MKQDLSELLLNALNEQGFIFQEACKHCLEEVQTGWKVKAFEYPVSLQRNDTRVDIVLRNSDSDSPELWALIECKRADPEYVYWLFGSPELPFGDASCSALGFSCLSARSDEPFRIRKLVEPLHFGISTYDAKSWTEVKRDSSRRISNTENIEKAFAQVLKGTAGFAEEHLEHRYKHRRTFKTFFIPIVITTAKLYVAEYKLKDVDLETGTISKEKVHLGPKGQPPEELEWMLIDYGAGENVAPSIIPEDYMCLDPGKLQEEYKTRSIFVVNSKSIPSFFSKLQLVSD